MDLKTGLYLNEMDLETESQSTRIAVFGLVYVGCVTAACFADATA